MLPLSAVIYAKMGIQIRMAPSMTSACTEKKDTFMSAQRLPTSISRKTVKLCELCGALNLETNKECWTCRWSGSFSRNPQTISLAWQRLTAQYEEVRIEHVTGRLIQPLGDFGAARPAPGTRKLTQAAAAWWQGFLDARDLRMAQRRARLRSGTPSPPDQLGV